MPQKQRFTDALADFINGAYPKESRVKNTEWAEKYSSRLVSLFFFFLFVFLRLIISYSHHLFRLLKLVPSGCSLMTRDEFR